MRCAGVRGCRARCAGVRHRSVPRAGTCPARVDRWATVDRATAANLAATSDPATAANLASATGKTAMVGRITAAAAIAPAASFYKPMAAPAIAIAPAGPWSHAQKDAVVEVPRPVKSIRRAGVGRVVVITVLANRLNADADDELRVGGRRHGQAREQSCAAQ